MARQKKNPRGRARGRGRGGRGKGKRASGKASTSPEAAPPTGSVVKGEEASSKLEKTSKNPPPSAKPATPEAANPGKSGDTPVAEPAAGSPNPAPEEATPSSAPKKAPSPPLAGSKRKSSSPDAPAPEDPGSPTKRARAAEASRKAKPEEEASGPAVSSAPKRANNNGGKKRTTKGGSFDPEFLLSSAKSKLATCDLNSLISSELAWTALTPGEQASLIAMLPGGATPGNVGEQQQQPELLRKGLRSNPSVKEGLSIFKEDLRAGRYSAAWLQRAAMAMERRAKGEFDSWKESEREDYWGQKGE